jgi:hypothetical protein
MVEERWQRVRRIRRRVDDHEVLDELKEDMTRADLITVLRHLPYPRQGASSALLLIDRGCRDYLHNIWFSR